MLKEMSDLMVELSGFRIQPTKPVVGDKIFGWETGMPSSLWLNCKDTEPLAMLPYLWTMTGQKEPSIYLGKKSGKDNIKKWLTDNGLTVKEELEQELLGMVKNKSISLKRDLTKEEFISLVNQLNEKGGC
jgi:isopropylmalate/homocitrate/citramalate synthase